MVPLSEPQKIFFGKANICVIGDLHLKNTPVENYHNWHVFDMI